MSPDEPGGVASSGATPSPDEAAIQEEARRLRQLRFLVDLTTALLAQEQPPRPEAERLVAATRQRILELFPDKGDTYELILAPRFARLVAGLPEPTGARVLPFRRDGSGTF
jgi:hypothetical protein